MLTDSENRKKSKRNIPRKIAEVSNKQWSDDQKREAIQTWLVVGNLAMTGRMLEIPEVTLRVWKASDWWQTVVAEIKTQDKIKLSNRLQKIVDASLAVVEDRLLNGDAQFDQKTGQIIRKPVAMKDAHKVAVDLQNRQDVLEKVTSKEESTPENVENKLLDLANKFADLATKKIDQKVNEHRTIDVVDAEIKESQ